MIIGQPTIYNTLRIRLDAEGCYTKSLTVDGGATRGTQEASSLVLIHKSVLSVAVPGAGTEQVVEPLRASHLRGVAVLAAQTRDGALALLPYGEPDEDVGSVPVEEEEGDSFPFLGMGHEYTGSVIAPRSQSAVFLEMRG